MQIKHFVGHEPCPQCGSKDNVGVWSDGQKYCFTGCGYVVPGYNGMNIEGIKKQLEKEQLKEINGDAITLPCDFNLVLRADAEAWLNKYGVEHTERFKYKIGWSDIYESLVLPCFDLYGNLLIVQRRYFGSGKWPKYHTKGRPELSLWTARPSHDGPVGQPETPYDGTIVVVEDYISAIKVGRQFEAMPLFGSSFSNDRLNRLGDRWSEIIFWLDQDKVGEAMNFRVRASTFFNEAWVVSTEKDPKDYNDNEIREYLQQHVDS